MRPAKTASSKVESVKNSKPTKTPKKKSPVPTAGRKITRTRSSSLKAELVTDDVNSASAAAEPITNSNPQQENQNRRSSRSSAKKEGSVPIVNKKFKSPVPAKEKMQTPKKVPTKKPAVAKTDAKKEAPEKKVEKVTGKESPPEKKVPTSRKRPRSSRESESEPVPVESKKSSSSEDVAVGKKPRKSSTVPAPPPAEPTFKTSERVYCYFSNRMYSAIVKETRHISKVKVDEEGLQAGGEVNANSNEDVIKIIPSLRANPKGELRPKYADNFVYFVHYTNWPASWDEWVRVDCLKPFTEETRAESAKLKQLADKEKKQLKKKRKSAKLKKPKSKGATSKKAKTNANGSDTMNGGEDQSMEDNDETSSSVPVEASDCMDRERVGNLMDKDRELLAGNLVDDMINYDNNGFELEPSNEVVGSTELQPKEEANDVVDAEEVKASTSPKAETTTNELKIDWKQFENPCAVIATPTVNDIRSELLEYIKSVRPVSEILSKYFVEKLYKTFDLFCRSLPPISRENTEKVIMSEKGVNRFVEVVHCGGIARLIQIMESKAELRMNTHSNEEGLDEDDMIDDMVAVNEACREYFSAAKRYFKEKYGIQFEFSATDAKNKDFELPLKST